RLIRHIQFIGSGNLFTCRQSDIFVRHKGQTVATSFSRATGESIRSPLVIPSEVEKSRIIPFPFYSVVILQEVASPQPALVNPAQIFVTYVTRDCFWSGAILLKPNHAQIFAKKWRLLETRAEFADLPSSAAVGESQPGRQSWPRQKVRRDRRNAVWLRSRAGLAL